MNDENINNAERPTDIPVIRNIGPSELRLFGRKVIYVDYNEDDMNVDTITKIMNDVFYIKYIDDNDIVYWYDRKLDKLYNDEFVEVDNFDINTLTKEPRNVSFNLGVPLEFIKLKSTKGYILYRVHTMQHSWLNWVDSSIKTGDNSYGGIKGHTIIGIQMK